MTEVLLIEPPSSSEFGYIRQLGSSGKCKIDTVWPPYDLMILKGLFNKHGIESKIIDANSLRYDIEKVKDIIKKEDPESVVFTISAWSVKNDVQVAKAAKEVSSDIVTIPTSLAMETIKENLLELYPYVDVCPYHEPELSILDLIKADYDPKNVQGIYCRIDGGIRKNKEYPKVKNMDDLGIPSHEIPFKIYKDPLMKRRPMTMVCASRACVNHCIHCLAPFQKPLRYRSIESVMEELRIVEDLGIKEVKFFDCGLTNNVKWTNEFCKKIIEERLDLTWNCNARADHMPLETARLMKKAGCHTVCIGSESADPQILKTIRKNETVEQIEEGVKNSKKAGLKVLMYFAFGFPGETKETLRKNIDFAKRMNPDFATFGVVTPAYGTEFYKYLEENKLFAENYEEKELSTTEPPVYNYPGLSSEEIYEISMKAYREFYLRPAYIIRRLVRSPGTLRNDMNSFMAFMKQYIVGQ